MARFVFELDAVLEQRRAAERSRQLAVAALEREKLGLEERVRDIQRSIAAEKEDLRDHLTPRRRDGAGVPVAVDMRTVRMQAGASLRLLGRAHHAAIQLAGVLARLQGARRELLEATTRRKAVERLRERRREAWRQAENRRENGALDELAVMRASRTEDEP